MRDLYAVRNTSWNTQFTSETTVMLPHQDGVAAVAIVQEELAPGVAEQQGGHGLSHARDGALDAGARYRHRRQPVDERHLSKAGAGVNRPC